MKMLRFVRRFGTASFDRAIEDTEVHTWGTNHPSMSRGYAVHSQTLPLTIRRISATLIYPSFKTPY